VLHLDVKPANILLDGCGRAYLADFNVSARLDQLAAGRTEHFGGTPEYMSPRHHEAFADPTPEKLARLDASSDTYALGRVLLKLCPGLGEIATREHHSAAEQARAFAAAREHETLRRRLPEAARLERAERRSPVAVFLLATVGPQLLGSAFNIGYNSLHVVKSLSPGQREAFRWLLLPYNLVSYPIGLWLVLRQALPLLRERAARPGDGVGEPAARTALRARARALPRVLGMATSLGWLPGALLFPWLLDRFWGPIAPGVYLHFTISFALSWLIAFSYSALAMEWLILRVYAPDLWAGEPDLRGRLSRELAGLPRRVRVYQTGCALIPLFAAALVTMRGPDSVGLQTLLLVLLAAGVAGFASSLWLGNQVERTLAAFSE
jgi:hypothetical protein